MLFRIHYPSNKPSAISPALRRLESLIVAKRHSWLSISLKSSTCPTEHGERRKNKGTSPSSGNTGTLLVHYFITPRIPWTTRFPTGKPQVYHSYRTTQPYMLLRLEQTIPISRNSYFDRLSQVAGQPVQEDPAGVAEEIEDLGASFSSFSTEAHEAEVKAAHAYKTKCPLPTAEPTSSLLCSVPNAATIPSSVYGNLSNSVRQRYKSLLPYTLDWRNNWASYTDISARVLDDPDYGVCDACGIVQIPDAFPPDSERESIRKFQISRAPAPAHRVATASPKFTHLPVLASSSSSSAAAQSPPAAQSVKKETKASAPRVTQENTAKPGSRARLQTSFKSSHILGNQVPSKYTSATLPVPTGPPSISLGASPFSSDPFRGRSLFMSCLKMRPS